MSYSVYGIFRCHPRPNTIAFGRLMLSFLTTGFLLLPATDTTAQLCTGSLGDPVVKLDFGSGSTTHGAALGSAITSYTYTSADFPSDGYYTIESTTNTPNTWWTTTDHTGGGYMMVVNASFSITDYFYKNTVSGLCPETTYEFAAWIMNLLRNSDTSPPDITFTIETTGGTILNTYTTGSIPLQSAPVWKQYGFYFTTPAGISTVVIRMRNNKAGAAPGNDIALDDITFRPCGPAISVALSGGDTSIEICQGLTTAPQMLGNLSGGYSSPSYQWQVSKDNGVTWSDIAGATAANYTLDLTLSNGTYLFRLTAANGGNISSAKCRIVSSHITVKVNAQPVAGSNNPLCQGSTLELYASGSSSYTYAWTGPNGFSSSAQNPVINNITAANNGMYYLTVSGYCSGHDSVFVSAHDLPDVDAGADVSICEGATVALNGTASGSMFYWSPGSSLSDSLSLTPTANPVTTTDYVFTASNEVCDAHDTVVVFVWQKPEVDAGPDKYIIKGTSTILDATSVGGDLLYAWTPGYNITASDVLNPEVSPETDTRYTIVATSSHGCGTASDTVLVKVYEKLSVPNIFSPNGDGINDTWRILQLSNYPDAGITVFNRYGQEVYKGTGYAVEWDGRHKGQLVPVGTYYYVIDLKINKSFEYKGWLEIVY
ncbi:gliding motility-associated C-terminal domain-containing protein [Rurimicrobium arvi]